MSQLVRLTWLHSSGDVIQEICELIGEDDKFCTSDGMSVDDSFGDNLAKCGLVLFEDYFGIFGLLPDQIKKIEVLR